MSTKNCPSCGAPVALEASECKYCGEKIAASQPQPQYTQPQTPQYQAPQYAPPQAPPQYQAPQYAPPQYAPQPGYAPAPYPTKSKTTAGLLGIFLGGLGVHKFYLGQIGLGIVYLIFCWTYIPALIGFIEGIIYLASSEENFQRKYVKR